MRLNMQIENTPHNFRLYKIRFVETQQLWFENMTSPKKSNSWKNRVDTSIMALYGCSKKEQFEMENFQGKALQHCKHIKNFASYN